MVEASKIYVNYSVQALMAFILAQFPRKTLEKWVKTLILCKYWDNKVVIT